MSDGLRDVRRTNSSVKTFESLAMKLFSVPRTEVSGLISLSLAISLSLFVSNSVLIWFISVSSLLLAIRVLSLKFNLKRVFFLSAILTAASSISYAVFGNLAGAFFIYLSVLYFCSDSGYWRVASYSTAVYLLTELLSGADRLVAILAYPLPLISFALYLKYMDRNVNSFNVKRFVKSFILYWLTSFPAYLENALMEVAERRRGKVRCLEIGGKKIVSTSFHPGPFRNVGGAKLVEEVRKKGHIYLHSPTTHIMNPVSGEDVEKISDAVESVKFTDVHPKGILRVSGDRYEVFCIPFTPNSANLFLVSGKCGIDDFTIDRNAFVVDCHNAHLQGYEMSGEDVEEISTLIDMLEEMAKSAADAGEMEAAFLRIPFTSESMCGVDVIAMKCGEKKIALIVFDSNNVNVEFRGEVERRVEKLGFVPIVASTDNHSRTGIKVKFSYKAAGDDDEDWKVVDEIVRGIEGCRLERVECRYGETEVEINVMGERFFRDSELAARAYAGRYVTLYLLLMVGNFFSSLLPYLFQHLPILSS